MVRHKNGERMFRSICAYFLRFSLFGAVFRWEILWMEGFIHRKGKIPRTFFSFQNRAQWVEMVLKPYLFLQDNVLELCSGGELWSGGWVG